MINNTLTGASMTPNLELSSDQNWHLARRACMGSNYLIASNIAANGINNWLTSQLNPSSINDADYEAERDRVFPLYMTTGDIFWSKYPDPLTLGSYQTLVRLGWLHEMYKSKKQLQCSMMNFWADQFSINFSKVPREPARHVMALRKNALGKFSDLLIGLYNEWGVVQFLDGQTNQKTAPNQNLARELLELHTMGVGNYTQDDVIAVARLLSGLKLGTTGTNNYVVPAQHDMNPIKLSFGWSNSNNNTTADGILSMIKDFLNYLAHRKETATRICTRLVRNFVSDTIDNSFVSRLVTTYLNNDTDIKPVLMQLFTSNEFKKSIGEKFKKPQQQLCNLLATLNSTFIQDIPAFPSYDHFIREFGRVNSCGHGPFTWNFPDGFPQDSDYWMSLSTMNKSWNIAEFLMYYGDLKNKSYFVPIDYYNLFNISKAANYEVAIKQLVERITGHTPTITIVEGIACAWAGTAKTPNIHSLPNINNIKLAVEAITATPYFQIS